MALPPGLGIYLAYGENDPEGSIDVPKVKECFEALGAFVEMECLAGLGHEMPKSKQPYFRMCDLFLRAIGRPYA